jgi:GMP synthase (glutamine-hydrolysing)
MKSLLIIKVGDALPQARARGDDFERWIARGFGPFAPSAAVVDARSRRDLPAPAALAGAVITGSGAMVTERAAWSEALVPWLNAAVGQAVPLLGICYGHQLLAHALGGEVDYHPQGMEIGTVQVRKTGATADDPLFADLPPLFDAQAVHSQHVRRLPDAAVCLAANDYEAHQAFRVGRCAWGVQFHPEFDAVAMQDYVREFGPALAARGRQPERIAAGLAPTPAAASILQRFARLALGA